MNSADRTELDELRREQLRVRNLLARLDERIDLLARRLEAPEPVVPPSAVPPPLPTMVPSPGPDEAAVERLATPEAPAPSPAVEQRAPATPAFPPVTDTPPQHVAATDESLELRVGTYWMSRLGIVILLTGLVFLGNYAYHRIVPLLGAWGKLSLLALAGSALGGLGAWLERSRESMRNYGRVLLAGGAATIYYAAYAAHFVDALRIIESPIIGGGLLLALTGAFVFYADRRQSEAVAVPAVLLAYYTSSINAIGTFTLFSNLLLTAVAALFLVRHRWLKLSFLSLAATYGSYTLWKLNHLLHVGGVYGEFGAGIIFLALYWILFTGAVFVVAPAAMRATTRVTFLSLNNGAFFALAASHFTSQHYGSFWIFALSYGGVLLALAVLAARWRSAERALDGAYLAQGLGLVTIGLAAKLTGPQLAVVLAAESALLLAGARTRHRLIFEIAAGLCAVGSCGLTIQALEEGATSPLAIGLPVVAFLFSCVFLLKRASLEPRRFSTRAAGFAVLALVTIAALLWHLCPAPWQPTAFALVAASSLLALRLRMSEIAWPAQTFLVGALLIFVSRHASAAPEPSWLAAPLIVISIGLMHWWQRQKSITFDDEFRALPSLACASIAVIAGIVWMHAFYRGDAWRVASSIAALACLGYGLGTRAWPLAAAGQAFTVLAAISFASAITGENGGRWASFAPVAAVGLTGWMADVFADRSFGKVSMQSLVRCYRLAALAMLGVWAFVYVEPAWRVIFYAGTSTALILIGALTADVDRRSSGAIYAATALAFFWSPTAATVTWLDLLGILAIPASLRLGQRICGEVPLLPIGRDALVGAAMASLWLWATRITIQHGHGAQLTIAWALLALIIFAAGLALRERIYRLGGFAILGLAIGRLFVVDVWRFDTLPRILSFLVLGIVLLLLSFVYNRFADVFRRWL